QLDTSQLHPRRVITQVSSRADGDLERVSVGLRGSPSSSVAEQDEVRDTRLCVVEACEVVEAAASKRRLVFGSDWHASLLYPIEPLDSRPAHHDGRTPKGPSP